MSLTDHLRDSGSPVRAYLDGLSPSLADIQGRSEGARAMAQALGLTDLARSKTLVPSLPGVDTARSGTAIDFRVRIALGGFDPGDSAAAVGVAELPFHASGVENGSDRARVLVEAFEVATRILECSSDEADLDRASILLACCEQVHRGGSSALKGSLGAALDAADDGLAFASGIDESSLTDVRALMEANAVQIDEWRGQIASDERFEPNPAFAGSALVGGADGDWLVGEALYDSKVYAELTVPKLRSFLRQLLGYVMLDLDDALGIRSVGLWLPRQRVTRVWTLNRLLGGDPEELLPRLRAGFQAAAGGKGVALRVPVTQRRKEQLLAENRHTPRRMLVDLALNGDVDIRFRVGRNVSTPEETVRGLARDRYAKAREGVARNERAPVEVLVELSRDSSIGVRRAAAANPRTPQKPAKTLGPGRSTQAQPAREAPATDIAVLNPAGGDGAALQSRNDRDDAAWDSDWLAKLLILTRGNTGSREGAGVLFPEASRDWARVEGRALDVPDWLMAGLPDAVKHDLLREGRPAWVRQIVADSLPIADPVIRDALLADTDPEIRWSTLRRTIDAPDDELGDMLATLAADRKERTRFRTEGDDRPRWERDRTPAEYDRETLELVAAHPSTPAAALRDLIDSKSPDILVALIGNPALSANDLATLLPRLRTIRPFEPRERLAASNQIPAAAARALCDDRDVRVRKSLARNQAVPIEVLSRLAEDPEPSVRLAVLQNARGSGELAASIAKLLLTSSTDEVLLDALRAVGGREDLDLPAELLEDALDRLSKSRVRQPDMRCIAARDLRTGPRTLARLSRSSDVDVRRAAAGNPRILPKDLDGLASAPESSVRAAVAGNETLPPHWLIALAHDDEPEVRASAASSPKLDPMLLGELLRDEQRSVQVAAFRNPSTRPEDRASAQARWEHARRESAPSRTDLEEMVASMRAEVRIRPAYDPRTPPDILVLLGGERRSAKVRRAVAANPNAPAALLASLANDKDEDVRRAVAFNRATPPAILKSLARTGVDLAILVALNPDTPTEILDELTGDAEPLVSHVATSARAVRVPLVRGGSRTRHLAADR